MSAAFPDVLMVQYSTLAVAAKMISNGLVMESVVMPPIVDEVTVLLLSIEIPVGADKDWC